MTAIDPWFLEQLRQMVEFEQSLGGAVRSSRRGSREALLRAKRLGISDAQIADAWKSTEIEVRERRKELGVRAVFNRVDTCSAEFESFTPYLYSTYETSLRSRSQPTARKS